MWKFAAILGLPLSLAAAGCGDTTTNGDGGNGSDMAVNVVIPHNFDQINTEILGPSCAGFSVCHSGAGAHDANKLNLAATNLDGSANDPYTALVGALAQNAKAMGEGQLRVKPCDSAHSFLIFKLQLAQNQDLVTGYGHYMPDTNPHLPSEQIQAISDWIDRGALRSEPATVTGRTCTLAGDMGAHD